MKQRIPLTCACFLAGLLALTLISCRPAGTDAVSSHYFSRVEIIGTRGTASGQFNKPRSLALDRDDNLYVVDMTGRVQKFSARGEFLFSWQMPQTDLGKPKGMATDTLGRIVIVEPHYQRVNHFQTNGTLALQWGHRGTNAGELILPRAIAITSQGDAWVSEYTTVDRLQRFSGSNQTVQTIVGRPGTGPGEFNRAEGLGVDVQDRVYVADSCNHRVQVFSPDGKWLRSFGQAGQALGEMSYPYDIRIDRAGTQFVCEFGNSRVQIFDAQGVAREILGGPGLNPGQFNNPWSIALDSHGNLYVADAGNHRVQKFIRKP